MKLAPTRDLAAVHAFYIGLLEHVMGHPVPVPPEATAADSLAHWLDLLDLAISPLMLRDGLKDSTTADTAEALLRHFCLKSSGSDADRDKTDFVITFLYRTTVPVDRQVRRTDIDVDVPSDFEASVYKVLGDQEPAALPDEHRQLVREFPFVRQDVEELRTFAELVDSGVIQRVREIKQRFGTSFYHPRVLSTIAEYNVFFGHRFDELFNQTAEQIKQFAATVLKHGGSILSRVDGDVTVKNLTDMKEHEVLNAEYGSAQEQLRKISKFKKAVDTRTSSAARPHAPVPVFHSTAEASASEPAFGPTPPGLEASVPAPEQTPLGVNPTIEQGKLQTMEDSIRNFVIAADPKSASVVPLRGENLALTPAEVEAFRADYGAEKSFRADYAAVLRAVSAIQSRFLEELKEYKSKQQSAYLWKPHADAITWLLTTSPKVDTQCDEVVLMAEKRGLKEKVLVLKTAQQKLRTQVQQAAEALQGNVS